MKRLIVLTLALGLAGCGTNDRANQTHAAVTGAAPPPATQASPHVGEEAVTRGGVAVQQPVSPMLRQVPTSTEREGISTPSGKIGTTGAF